MTDSVEEMVGDFQKAFDTPMTKEFWGELILEELKEAQDAYEAFLLECADVVYVTAGLMNVEPLHGPFLLANLAEKAIEDGVLDAGLQASVVEALDTLDPDLLGTAFVIKHQSNMSKVNPDGSVSRDPDTGKVLKPEGYVQPTLKGKL